MSSAEASTFDHQACLYDSDRQFLEMARPFLETGVANGEPVLAVTTPGQPRADQLGPRDPGRRR